MPSVVFIRMGVNEVSSSNFSSSAIFLERMVFLINWPPHSCSFYHSLPPVTKAYGTLCFLTTVAYQLNLLNPEWIYLDYTLVTKKFQVRQELGFLWCGEARIFKVRLRLLIAIAGKGFLVKQGAELEEMIYLWILRIVRILLIWVAYFDCSDVSL